MHLADRVDALDIEELGQAIDTSAETVAKFLQTEARDRYPEVADDPERPRDAPPADGRKKGKGKQVAARTIDDGIEPAPGSYAKAL